MSYMCIVVHVTSPRLIGIVDRNGVLDVNMGAASGIDTVHLQITTKSEVRHRTIDQI